MSREQWESLCDGCAKCCLLQLEDEDTEQLVFTNVACDLLDFKTCRCTDYANRSVRVPSCLTLDSETIHQAVEFAPSSCAYRLVYEGKPLPEWHHLVSQDPLAVHSGNRSVKDKVVSISSVNEDDIEDHVVEWPLDSA